MNLEWWIAPWRSEANVWLVVSAFFVALACALPGVFLILRRMALAGDAISHSVLPGIVVAFLFTGSLDSPLLVAGAAASGLVVMLVIEGLHRGAGIREDAATGIAFTAFFALGVLLLRNYAGKVDLDPDCVLFGSLETAVHGERWEIAGLAIPRVAASGMLASAGVSLFLLLGFPALLISSFDPGHARTAGFRPSWTNVALMAVTALVVVVAFQAVGAILAVALLILPGATGLLCAKRVRGVLTVAAAHAAVSSVGGLYLAVALNCNVAAAIVLAGAVAFVLAWLFGPMDGLCLRRKKN
jgi:manganese/zinc/iron transport system permease protein